MLAFGNGDVLVVSNLAEQGKRLPGGVEVLLVSGDLEPGPAVTGPLLPPDTTVWLRRR